MKTNTYLRVSTIPNIYWPDKEERPSGCLKMMAKNNKILEKLITK